MSRVFKTNPNETQFGVSLQSLAEAYVNGAFVSGRPERVHHLAIDQATGGITLASAIIINGMNPG
jgi:hypothetical protein